MKPYLTLVAVFVVAGCTEPPKSIPTQRAVESSTQISSVPTQDASAPLLDLASEGADPNGDVAAQAEAVTVPTQGPSTPSLDLVSERETPTAVSAYKQKPS